MVATKYFSQRSGPRTIPPDGANSRNRPEGKGSAMNIHASPRTAQHMRFLEGKVSVVTGSTSGIGLGIARALAASGSSVILNGFGRSEDIEVTRQDISADFGVPALHSAADVTNPAAIREMLDLALDQFGRIDIHVNN